MGNYDQSVDLAIDQWLEDEYMLKQAEYYMSQEDGQYCCEAESFSREFDIAA